MKVVLLLSLLANFAKASIGESVTTVPSTQDVFAEAVSEHRYVSDTHGIEIPQYHLSVYDWSESQAFSVLNPSPMKYNVILNSSYPNLGQTEFIIDHEIGHIMLAELSQPQDEDMAHYFAYCFGSIAAKNYGIIYYNLNKKDSVYYCAEWKKLLWKELL